jgi:hypothetical protein
MNVLTSLKGSLLLWVVLSYLIPMQAQSYSYPSQASCSGFDGPLNHTVINGGKTYYVFDNLTIQNLEINNGTLIVCGHLTILDNLQITNSNVIINTGGKITTKQILMNDSATIANYGTVETDKSLHMYGMDSRYFNITPSSYTIVHDSITLYNNAFLVNVGHIIADYLLINVDTVHRIVMEFNSTFTINYLENNAYEPIRVPSGNACMCVKEDAYLNDYLTFDEDLMICLGPNLGLPSYEYFGDGEIYENCQSCLSSLPVTLQKFEANTRLSDPYINIKWSTTSEENNHYFTLKKSEDGIHFHPFHQTYSKGNSLQKVDYEVKDFEPMTSPIVYYQLFQTDRDGHETYVAGAHVRLRSSTLSTVGYGRVVIAPNPAQQFITLQSERPISAFDLKLTDINGRKIIAPMAIQQHKATVDVSGLSNGLYVLTLDHQTYKIIKN